MAFAVLQRRAVDVRAWLAFFLGAVACVLALSYGEVQKEPSGMLVFDVSSTQPGALKVLYTKDDLLTDPGWTVNFSPGISKQQASFPLNVGRYDLVGFKPLVKADGQVSIRNLRIISSAGVRNINIDNFVAINQLNITRTQNTEIVIAPALGANDPFGVIPNLHELVPRAPITLSFLWIAAGKFTIIAIFLALMYGFCGSLPFARGESNQATSEPGWPQWLGLLVVGLIVLYLRNAHSLTVPVLYAEDGVWSAGLINRGFFDMLFNAREDYFVFGNVLLLAWALLNNIVFFGHDLTYLPHFVSLFSMLFYAALAVAPIALLRNALRLEARLLLWFFVLLVPLGNSSYEVLGRLSNIGFAFLFLSFCLLVWRCHLSQNLSRKQIVVTDVMLFLCANTNPLCYPLIAVAFSIEGWHHWNSNNRPRMDLWLKKYLTVFSARSAISLLAALFLMGLWMLLREKSAYSFLSGKIALSNIPEAIFARIILYPIIFPIYSKFNNVASGGLFIAIIVVVILLAKGRRRERYILASAGVVLLMGAFITIMSRPGLTVVLDHYRTSNPDRYYFGLTLLVYLTLTAALSSSFGAERKSWRRISGNALAGSLIALYAGNNELLFEFAKPRFEILPRLTFVNEVKKAYEQGGEGGPNGMRYKVALHPAPWIIYIPAEYVISTALGIRDAPPLAISDHQSKVPIMQLSDIARKYDGKVVHKTAGRGREEGLFYVSRGVRSWISNDIWLKQKNLSPADVIEISHEEFSAIPDSGEPVK